MSDGTPYLDGNAAGGEIGALLAIDVTMARGECVGCGADMALATARMYGPAPGLVLRCPSCDGVLLRVVETPGRAWMDLRGLAYVEVVTTG
jgi:Family of unknown function (DUF6510)